MTEKRGYERIAVLETSGSEGTFGVVIKTLGQVNDQVKLEADKCVRQIYNELIANAYRNDFRRNTLNEEEVNQLKALFKAPIYVEEIPNEYKSKLYNPAPWLIVTTVRGRIKIGWGKRAISIDWSDSDIEDWAEELFKDEEVTKFGKGIHAWGYAKAAEFLRKLGV